MHKLATAAVFTAFLLLASCAPRSVSPPPGPAPVPRPERPPPPLPAPPPRDWQDAALSPGDWSYQSGGRPSASFGLSGSPQFMLRCEGGRQVSLILAAPPTGTMIAVRTSYGERSLAATNQANSLVATLNASDPLLDSIVFSRGRFALEAAGRPMLILPAWPEPARVIEDCRG